MFHLLVPVVEIQNLRRVTTGWGCRICGVTWPELPPREERDRCEGEAR